MRVGAVHFLYGQPFLLEVVEQGYFGVILILAMLT